MVAEALGLALPHSALTPSGEPSWLELGARSALALMRLKSLEINFEHIVTDRSIENAMLVHAAFGGSTNLLLLIPAIARAAGLRAPTVSDWHRVNCATPRLVDALPNGPRGHPTVQVFMAGGVPEVMLHLRRMGSVAHRRGHGDRRHARRDTRLVGVERPPHRRARTAWRRIDLTGRRHHESGRGALCRSHEHDRLSGRESCSRGLSHQGDGDRREHCR